MNFAVPVDNRMEIKESKKIDKYMDLAKELRKLWDMKVTIIPVVAGVLKTAPKDMKRRLGKLAIRGRI